MKKVLAVAGVAVIAIAIVVIGWIKQHPADRLKAPELSMRQAPVQGTDIAIRAVVKNWRNESIEVPYAEDDRSLIAWAYTNRANIKLTRDGGETVPMQKMPDNVESFAKLHTATRTLKPDESFSYEIDLRKVFEFPMEETASYTFTMQGTNLAFSIAANRDIVMRSADEHMEVEYAVIKTHGVTNLAGRIKGQVFKDIGQLDILPFAMRNFGLFNVPWCPKGQIVFLATPGVLHVLPPEHTVPGAKELLTPVTVACPGIEKIVDLSVSKDMKNNHTDLTIGVSVGKGERKSLRLRLKDRTVSRIE